MQITYYSISMTVLWSSILIIIFYLLRKKSALLDVCSVSGVIALYLFCAVRLFVPLEFPWIRVIPGGEVVNKIYSFLYFKSDINGMFEFLLIISILLVGTLLFLLVLAVRYVRQSIWLNRIPAEKGEKYNKIMKRIEEKGESSPDIIITSVVDSPQCFGVIKRKIILPNQDYSEEDLYYILLHEYSHLRNKDLLVIMLVNIMCAIYWWNPLVYLLKKDLNQSLEIRCDSTVSQKLSSKERIEYLDVLKREYEETVQPKKPRKTDSRDDFKAYLVEHHSDELIERFRLVAKGKMNVSRKNSIVAYAIGIVLLVLSYSFNLQAWFAAPKIDYKYDHVTYEVESDESYIIHTKNGEYIFHTEAEDTPMSEEGVNFMLDNGFVIKEE